MSPCLLCSSEHGEQLEGLDIESCRDCEPHARQSVHMFEAHVKRCQLQSFSFDYYMHGLVEEVGEVFEAVRAHLQVTSKLSDSVATVFTERSGEQDAVLYELGDVLWYMTSLSMEVGDVLAMPEVWPEKNQSLGGPVVPAIEPEVLMMACVAKLSGRVKKSLRGDKPLQDFAPAMKEHRDELLGLCAMVAANHGATLQRCADMNVKKLSGRFDRGSVQGDGDKR